MPKVYVILVNWNGWRDTIECLESLFRLDYPDFTIIVCDNASSDESLANIKDWARGTTPAECLNHQLRHLVDPPIPKPVEWAELRPAEIASGEGPDPRLILIQTGANLGFAGGNNAGLSYALSRSDFSYAWLLNNDTVVEPDSLTALVARASASDRIGMCGSKTLRYDDPSSVQAFGGFSFNRWFARGGAVAIGSSAGAAQDPEQVERRLAYIAGSSLLVSRQFLELVGLMNERYFLYFEELDWAMRAKGTFRLAYSPDSIVYHKEGSSIGTNAAERSGQSPVAEYYGARNRIRFTWRYFPYALGTVLLALTASSLARLARGRWSNLEALLRGVLGLPPRNWTRQKLQRQAAVRLTERH